MSKAFTRESDDEPEDLAPPPPRPPLPPGTKNYITANGARGLRDELTRLTEIERPKLGAANDPEIVRRRRILDQRMQWLHDVLQSAVVIDPTTQPTDQVRFGASVTVRHRSGEEVTYRIVGVDETNLERDWISWLSPLAKALANARVEQRVKVRLPGGEDELEVLKIEYHE